MDEPHVIPPDDTPVQPTVATPRYLQRGLQPAQVLQRPRYALAAAVLMASPPDFFHLYNAVINPITSKSQEYHKLIKVPKQDVWIQGFANDLVRSAQGVGTRMPKGNNSIFLIEKKSSARRPHRHLWLHRRQRKTQQSRTLTRPPHSRRRSPKLPRHHCNIVRQPHNVQVPIQQHHINPRRALHVPRHWQLLLQHAHEPLQIHAHLLCLHTTQNCWSTWLSLPSAQRMGLYGNPQWHAQIESSRPHCQWPTHHAPSSIWLRPRPTHIIHVTPRNPVHHIFSCLRWFWCKVCWKEKCRAPSGLAPHPLPHIWRLDRFHIPWPPAGLGLQKSPRRHFNA